MAQADVAETDWNRTHKWTATEAQADVAEPDTTQNEWPLMAQADVTETDLNHTKNESTEPSLSQLG